MESIEIAYNASTTETFGDQTPSEKTQRLRMRLSEDLLALDDSETCLLLDFAKREQTLLHHATRTLERSPLFASVHDRLSGYQSAVHAHKVLEAGGKSIGQPWQIQAAYGLALEENQDELQISHRSSKDEQIWTIDGLEVARYRPSSVSVDRPMLERWLNHAVTTHPQIISELLKLNRLPAFLRLQNHFYLNRVDRTLTLLDDAPAKFAPQTWVLEYRESPVKEPALAQAPSPEQMDHIGRAQEAFDARRLVEATLACLAHVVSEIDPAPAQTLLQKIQQRSLPLSGVRKFLSVMEQVRDPKEAMKRNAKRDRLRGQAGAYEHILDLFNGEQLFEIGENKEALAYLQRTLTKDQNLAGPWVSIGKCYMELLDFELGWRCWMRALSLCPNHPIVSTVRQWQFQLPAEFPGLF